MESEGDKETCLLLFFQTRVLLQLRPLLQVQLRLRLPLQEVRI